MPNKTVDDEVILAELQEIPQEQRTEVLEFIRALKQRPPATDRPIISGTDLANSDLIGIWADRSDIEDSHEYARRCDIRQNTGEASPLLLDTDIMVDFLRGHPPAVAWLARRQ